MNNHQIQRGIDDSITTASKIQTFKLDDPMSTVPQNETYMALQASTIMLKVLEIMQKMKLPITKAILFIDAISTLISLGNHPAKYKTPFRRWLSATNVNLFKSAQITGQTK